MDNVPFCHILLRTNEALLDLILGLSGCLHFLATAFTFVITGLANSPSNRSQFCESGWPAGFLPLWDSVQSSFPHPRDLKVSKHECKFDLTLIRSINKAVNATLLTNTFSLTFLFSFFVVFHCCFRAMLYLLWGMNSIQWGQLSTFSEFEGLKFSVITLICCLKRGSNADNNNNSATNNKSIHVPLIARCLGKDHKPGNTELVDFRY